jgi:hypothetical protein
MRQFRKCFLTVAAAAILVVVLTLATPRAVHAVTSALVTITNSADNPAVIQGVSQLTTQNVYLVCRASPGGSNQCVRELPDGTASSTPFIVPTGESLVVTTVEIIPVGTNQGPYIVAIFNGRSGAGRKTLVAPPVFSTQYQYPSGIVFPALESVQLRTDTSNPGDVGMFVHGYLTTN